MLFTSQVSSCESNFSVNVTEDDEELDSFGQPGNTDVNYHYRLQQKLSLFAVKHRELHSIPKSAMASIISDMRDIIMVSHNAFAQSVLHELPPGSNVVMDSALESEEVLLDDIFTSVSSTKQLKKFCVQHLHMIQPRECVAARHTRNGKLMKMSFCYIPILETVRKFSYA